MSSLRHDCECSRVDFTFLLMGGGGVAGGQAESCRMICGSQILEHFYHEEKKRCSGRGGG